ncbi:MAG: aconitate hydratase AcnA [Thermoanaerobaculia bacterium]|nr:aconitate hydratase AcnA [Thermoanaerobaculia bacterium]
MSHQLFDSLKTFDLGNGKTGQYYSLPQLEAKGVATISRLPVSIRVVLESVLRNYDGKKISEADVVALAKWGPNDERTAEIPFMVARVVLQDFTGVPLLVDLAAMRAAVKRAGKNPAMIEPLVPVDLVIDHSVQVDYSSSPDAYRLNMEKEFERNGQRYQFLKWGMQAFDTFKVVPPGIGIVHQVNLEFLARGVLEKEGVWYPDTLVGTDSHTTMINGLGIVGWGVGGIEAEAGMLGQPVYFLTPDVVGVNLHGKVREGVTATDVVLRLTQMLRKAKVVGKFVEYFGEGATSLSLADRATIANMAPEYGATMGFFPVDEETCNYLRLTGRSDDAVNAVRNYYKAQGLFGIPKAGDIDYSQTLELDLSTVVPNVAGPKRPQDNIELTALGKTFVDLLGKPVAESGYAKPAGALARDGQVTPEGAMKFSDDFNAEVRKINHGDVLIAAITSCTNTSNPSVMIGAGLLAKKAVEKGLKARPIVKRSLGPGSRVVTDYFMKSGLQPFLDQLGFHLVGYGCTTCIGNSGPLHPDVEAKVVKDDIVAASVLSGNRNFEARVHQNIKANFLMSPPLVVAFAIAGRVDIDMTTDALGVGKDGKPVYLKDIWPTTEEIKSVMEKSLDPETFKKLYKDFTEQNPAWNEIAAPTGETYTWDADSTYIQEPPFFEGFTMSAGTISEIKGARALAILGDSVTTDHISPAGSFKASTPAGKYLVGLGVKAEDFNSYGARRGNDRIMTRGTFANVRIRNKMLQGVEGGYTAFQPTGEQMAIYDAAMKYRETGTPLVVVAGQEYGTGSSRDWAAKGTALLGVKAVVAKSFERIHRSNLVGMGVLPCQFEEGTDADTLKLDGTETFDLTGIGESTRPRQKATLVITRKGGEKLEVPVTVRIDTPIEVDYFRHGGILPYVLRQLISAS